MGYGDELMATGIAKIQKKKNPDSQIVIGNFQNRTITQSIIFDNNPNIITDSKKIDPKVKLFFINNSNLYLYCLFFLSSILDMEEIRL